MNIICGICHEEIEVPDNLTEGQHVKCPFCGEKSAFSRPARIAVPLGLEPEKAKPAPAVPDSQKLHVIRDPNRPAWREDPAAAEKVTLSEARVKMFDDMRHRAWRRRVLGNAVSACIILALALSGLAAYFIWREHRARTALIAEQAARERTQETERRERHMREEAERARAAREKRDAETRAARAAARAANETAAREAAARAEAERLAMDETRRANLENYRAMILSLRENAFDLFYAGVTNRASQSGCALCYLLPSPESPAPIYAATYGTNGLSGVTRYEADGTTRPTDPQAFLERLDGLDYLVANEESVYFHARRTQCRTGRLDKAQDGNPAEAFFGLLARQVSELGAYFDELNFEILFAPKNGDEPIVCQTLDYGRKYSLAAVREKLEWRYPPHKAQLSSSPQHKKFKRTVVIWDGSMIKRGVDDITYVPRTYRPPQPSKLSASGPGWHWYHAANSAARYAHRAQYTYEQWKALYEKALQEDLLENQFHTQQDIDNHNRQQIVINDAIRIWKERIDKILESGTLFYRIKKNKSSIHGRKSP